MQYAPFWRKADKFAFMAGTSMIIAFSFIIGRFPNDVVYTFTSIILPFLIATRYVHYILVGWHVYLVDFCYYANFMLLYYLNFDPKNVFVSELYGQQQLFFFCESLDWPFSS